MSRYPTDEDRALIKDYIELPHVLSVLNTNAGRAESFRLPHIFKLHLTTLMDRVTADIAETRKKMRKNGIKVLIDEREKDMVYVKYRCRNYEQEFRMLDGWLQAGVEMRFAYYLDIDISKVKRE